VVAIDSIPSVKLGVATVFVNPLQDSLTLVGCTTRFPRRRAMTMIGIKTIVSIGASTFFRL
jgi:hypothetical protein